MAQEASEIVSNVIQAASRLHGLLGGHFSRFGLNEIRYEVLRIVDGASQEGCSQAELADRLDQSESSVSTLVDRMRKDGLLYRLRSKTDRRMRSLMLTEKGRELYTAARACHDDRLSELLRAVDPVHVSMLNMLLKLLVGELAKVEIPAAAQMPASIPMEPVAPAAVDVPVPSEAEAA